ncbi:MAG: tetratricopeptide repeat protein, partial [Victivallales bacterium]|nr:tetratricopeptide repeat protein [Victivallales bacterium]
ETTNSHAQSAPTFTWFSECTRMFQRLISVYAGLAVALAIVAWSRLAVTGTLIPKLSGRGIFIDNPICDATFGIRLLTAFHVQGLALAKFFWPAKLAHDYSFAQITPISSILDPLAVFAVLSFLVLPLAILPFLAKSARSAAVFLWLAYLLSILPTGNFIVPTGTIFGERLTYLPSVWLCVIVVAAVAAMLLKFERLLSSKRFFLAETLLSLAILAALFRTSIRTGDWKNMRTLSVSAVSASPLSVKTWNNLAVEFAHRKKYEEAIAACDKAVSIKADFQSPKVNKIYYLIALKRYDEAERFLRKIIARGTDDCEMYNKLAGILARKGKLKEAMKLLRKSLSINPKQKQIEKTLKNMERIR